MSLALLYAVRGDEPVALPVGEQQADIHALLAGAPPGIYSALRGYPGARFFRLDAHLERCQSGIERAGWTSRFDFEALVRAIDRAARAYPDGDFRLRFDLLEEPSQRAGFRTQMLLAFAPHAPVPEAVMQAGAALALAPEGLLRVRPLIKFSDWVRERRVCEAQEQNAYEYLLLDDQRRILEGISSNFFAVRGGAIVTAGAGVLQGITQRAVLELAQQRGVRVQWRPPLLEELPDCEEAFITSSTRGVVPVSSVAGARIGAGTPGPFVMRLAAEYAAYAEQNARPARS